MKVLLDWKCHISWISKSNHSSSEFLILTDNGAWQNILENLTKITWHRKRVYCFDFVRTAHRGKDFKNFFWFTRQQVFGRDLLVFTTSRTRMQTNVSFTNSYCIIYANCSSCWGFQGISQATLKYDLINYKT